MHLIRKVALIGAALLAITGAVTSSALAVQAYDTTTGTALAVGSKANWVCDQAVSPGSCTLSGSVSGFSIWLTCSQMVIVGTVLANPDASGNVVGSADSVNFSLCRSSSGQPCSVVISGLPWRPDTNHGGVLSTSTTSGAAGTGSGSITVSGCLYGFTCTFKGGTAGPLGTAPYTLTNYAMGPWANPNGSTSPPQIHVGGAPNILPSPSYCGPWSTWTADFTVRTGSTIGSGNLVGLR